MELFLEELIILKEKGMPQDIELDVRMEIPEIFRDKTFLHLVKIEGESVDEFFKDTVPASSDNKPEDVLVSTENKKTLNDEADSQVEFRMEDIYFGTGSPVSTDSEESLPVEYALDQNYPNPFNPRTTIGFSLPQASEVELIVYDLLGRKALIVVDEEFPPGKHTIQVDGSRLASGTYIYRMVANDQVFTKTMHLVK